MSKITGNELAFPAVIDTPGYKGFGIGLTIRQYYAGLAMQGILASWTRDSMPEGNGLDIAVRTSVDCADALINELNKSE